jgi:hypothetical protein
MFTSPRISVILDGPSDWDEWIEIMKVIVLAGKIWDYIDPSKDQVPVLEEPKPPKPRNVNDQTSIFRQLL